MQREREKLTFMGICKCPLNEYCAQFWQSNKMEQKKQPAFHQYGKNMFEFSTACVASTFNGFPSRTVER